MGAYISQLPSTPQMARYTAARSAYTDPTVGASPPNPWGSSLAGGCAGCNGVGGGGCAGCGALSGATGESTVVLGLIGLLAGGYLGYKLSANASASKTFRFFGTIAGALAGDLVLNKLGSSVDI